MSEKTRSERSRHFTHIIKNGVSYRTPILQDDLRFTIFVSDFVTGNTYSQTKMSVLDSSAKIPYRSKILCNFTIFLKNLKYFM